MLLSNPSLSYQQQDGSFKLVNVSLVNVNWISTGTLKSKNGIQGNILYSSQNIDYVTFQTTHGQDKFIDNLQINDRVVFSFFDGVGDHTVKCIIDNKIFNGDQVNIEFYPENDAIDNYQVRAGNKTGDFDDYMGILANGGDVYCKNDHSNDIFACVANKDGSEFEIIPGKYISALNQTNYNVESYYKDRDYIWLSTQSSGTTPDLSKMVKAVSYVNVDAIGGVKTINSVQPDSGGNLEIRSDDSSIIFDNKNDGKVDYLNIQTYDWSKRCVQNQWRINGGNLLGFIKYTGSNPDYFAYNILQQGGVVTDIYTFNFNATLNCFACDIKITGPSTTNFIIITPESLQQGQTFDVNKIVYYQTLAYDNAAYLKLNSSTTQIVNSDVALATRKKLLLTNLTNAEYNGLSLGEYNQQDLSVYEQVEIGSETLPLCLNHCFKSTNGEVVGKNIIVNYKDSSGTSQADKVAYVSDLPTYIDWSSKMSVFGDHGPGQTIWGDLHKNWNIYGRCDQIAFYGTLALPGGGSTILNTNDPLVILDSNTAWTSDNKYVGNFVIWTPDDTTGTAKREYPCMVVKVNDTFQIHFSDYMFSSGTDITINDGSIITFTSSNIHSGEL